MTATDHLAEFVATTRLADIPADVVARGRLVLADCIGCMVAGAVVPEMRRLAALHADRVMFALGADVERLKWGVALARKTRREAGLDPDEVARIKACIKVVEQARRDARREKTAFEVTSSARDVDGVHMLEELGATRCQAGVSAGPRGHKDDFIAGLKRYADGVIAKV